jgi:AcrB/AcrD/AcrF family
MLARFFIDRPVLAWVISIVIVLLGAISAGFLPVAEYPEITPPTVRVTASYPGADASSLHTSRRRSPVTRYRIPNGANETTIGPVTLGAARGPGAQRVRSNNTGNPSHHRLIQG